MPPSDCADYGFTEFELRQLATLREELDDEYGAGLRVDLTVRHAVGERPLFSAMRSLGDGSMRLTERGLGNPTAQPA